MAEVIYSQLEFVFPIATQEQKLLDDYPGTDVRHWVIQNNTQYDVNVLFFAEPSASSRPLEFCIRAAGTLSVPIPAQYFAIYSAQTEPPGDSVPAAGKGGIYNGPGSSPSGSNGYIAVIGLDEQLPMFSSGDPVNSNAYISGALPAGTNNIGHVDVDTLPPLPAGANNIGHVDVDTLPEVDPSGWTWMKVTAAAAGVEMVKNAAGRVAQLVADSANAGVNINLQDGANQAWNQGNYTGAVPISCTTSIQVNFSAAGSAWILYK